MTAAPIGEIAADQHPQRGGDEQSGEDTIGGSKIEGMERNQSGDKECLHTGRRHADGDIEREHGENRS